LSFDFRDLPEPFSFWTRSDYDILENFDFDSFLNTSDTAAVRDQTASPAPLQPLPNTDMGERSSLDSSTYNATGRRPSPQISGNLDMGEPFRFDFSALEGPEILENFDFDSFLNTSTDVAYTPISTGYAGDSSTQYIQSFLEQRPPRQHDRPGQG
jgi:hypothetical protein